MFIRIPPHQIPLVWDAIKFAVVRANRIPEKDAPLYLNQLLQSLLSGTAQCFVRLSDDKELEGIGVTRIIHDIVTGEKSLHIESLYAFKRTTEEEWEAYLDIAKTFALKNDCKKITAISNVPRVFEIAESLGFKERFRSLELEV